MMEKQDYRKITILYVEDDHKFAGDTRELLEYYGFSVLLAETCFDGYILYMHQRPDILLLDYRLKETTGLKLLESIRKNDLNTAIVFYTDYDEKEIQKKVLELNADGYIWKREDIDMVVTKLKNIYRRINRNEEKLHVFRLSDTTTFNYRNGFLKIGENEERLTPMMCGILKMLCENINQIVLAEDICRRQWNNPEKKEELRRYIPRIKKILKIDATLKLINIWGKGYLLKSENN